MRRVIGAVGVAVMAYGAVLLLSREDDLLHVAIWLAGGVLLHDAVLAPVVVMAGGLLALPTLRLPREARAAVAVVTVVLGSVTLLAIPVLGRFGAKADNPTLLDRDYTTGWLLLALLVVAAASGWALAARRGVRSQGRATPREGD